MAEKKTTAKKIRRKKKKAPEQNLTPAQVLERYTEGPKSGVFTDGACSGNPGPGGWGFVWVEDGEIVSEGHGEARHTTNNRMELQALIEAYKELPRDARVHLYSDSNLCVKTLNEWAAGWQKLGWKRKTGPVENLELVREAYALHLKHPRARLEWIKAHNGARWNEYADALATSYLRHKAVPKAARAARPQAASADGLDVARLRDETPGCAELAHLNNAGAALMPQPVTKAIREHLSLENRMGGYEAAEHRQEAVAAAYDEVARLVGAKATNVALVENATAAMAAVLSAIPFERGDTILTTRNDYVSNQIMYLSLARRCGVEVVHAPDLPEGGVDPDAASALVRQRRPKLVAIAQMPTSSGLLQPVTPIAGACREAGVPLVVDASQTVGQLPLDVEQLGCDFLVATGRKFLRAPRGTGFLVVGDRALQEGWTPLFPDVRGADWEAADRFRTRPTAARFESWEFSYALVLGLGAAARYANALDGKAVARRVRALAAGARRRLAEIDGVRALDRGAWLGAIATFAVDGFEGGGEKLLDELRRRGANASVTSRAVALFDFQEKGVAWALRVSPHYYNTEEEIDVLAGALSEILV